MSVTSLSFRNNSEIKTHNMIAKYQFLQDHKENLFNIDIDNIELLNSIHTEGQIDLSKELKPYIKHNKVMNEPVIVYPLDCSDKYNLLMGWKGYQIAKALRQSSIPAVIYLKTRKQLLNEIQFVEPFSVVSTSSLKIPARFDMHPPKKQKLDEIHKYYLDRCAPMKPIIVSSDMTIIDGYAQYVYNRNMEIDQSEVYIVNN